MVRRSPGRLRNCATGVSRWITPSAAREALRLHADLTILAKLVCALARVRALPLAAELRSLRSDSRCLAFPPRQLPFLYGVSVLTVRIQALSRVLMLLCGRLMFRLGVATRFIGPIHSASVVPIEGFASRIARPCYS
jgi:hypothetical protein